MITRQEAFDTALTHLRVQGRRAVDEVGRCMYRTKTGLKCAIGALISDDKYSPHLEGMSVGESEVYVTFNANKSDIEFYVDLQDIHDDSIIDFLFSLEKSAKEFAVRYNLAYFS